MGHTKQLGQIEHIEQQIKQTEHIETHRNK